MASGSSYQRSRAPTGANDAHIPPLNPEFVAMSAMELVAHLKRHRHRTSESDLFADAALVFAERERRLEEAEELIRKLEAENQALQQPRAAEAPACALQQPRACNAKAPPLQQPRAANANKPRTRHSPGTSQRTQQVVPATGEVGDVVLAPMKKKPYRAQRMSAPLGFPNSGDESLGDDDDDPTSAEGEVRHNVPRYGSLRMNASFGFGGRSAPQAKQPRRRS